ncbi:MAG TPA: iron-containing alcohol dehydrogenase, partial [Thermoleophilia bacterium]|nr:iron-containing alcohol dehydrogenase [Thermoleophilia bacterium]
ALRRRLAAAPDAGSLRPLGLRTVVFGGGALERLPEAVDDLVAARGTAGPVAVLTDQTPKRCRSGDLLATVTGALATRFAVRPVTLGSPGRAVHADEETVIAAGRAAAGAACLVAVGSGTVTDIGKAVAATHRLPYAVVQTAGSVNGFADDRSVLLVSGVKRTTQTTWADALVVDTDVLVDAPPELNVSGFADLIATFTAPADWYLATALGMDDVYLPTVVALARERGDELLAAAPLVPRAERGALERVAAILTLSGVSMGIAGTTAPCSGMEHAVGHLLEMATLQAGGEPALHGVQVGAASVVTALLWQRVLGELADGGLARVRVPDQDVVETRVRSAFLPVDPSGAMGEECWRDVRRKLARWARAGEHVARAARDWAVHDRALRELLAAPDELVAALRAATAPARFAELRPVVAADDVRWAVASCHLMRERFSVADMAFLLGIWNDDCVAGLLSEAETLKGAR